MEKRFRLDTEGLKELRKQTIKRLMLTYLVAVVIIFIIITYRDDGGVLIPWFLLVGLLLFFLLVGAYTLAITLKKQKEAWLTFELIIKEDSIERHQNHLPPLTIERETVIAIEEWYNGVVNIKTADKGLFIALPKAINNRAELLTLLTDYQSIERIENTKLTRVKGLYPFLSLIPIGAAFIATNPIIVIPCGLLTIGLMIYSAISIFRNKMLSKKYKLTMLLLILPTIAILVKTVDAIISVMGGVA